MTRRKAPQSGRLTRRETLQGTGALVGSGLLGAACSGDDDSAADEDSPRVDGGTPTMPGVMSVPDASAEDLLAAVDHFVVVMMENRSFDHYFGSYALDEGRDVDGLSGTESNARLDGTPVPIANLAEYVTTEDPDHGWDGSRVQFNGGFNDGFVRAHEEDHGSTATEFHHVMGYYRRDQLPVLYALADEYVLCNRWFCSVMGPTWPNRYFLHLGTSAGIMSNDTNADVQAAPSLYARTIAAGLTNRHYYGNLPFPALHARSSDMDMFLLDQFFTDAAAGNLPNVATVDPILTAGTSAGNDDHPPAHVLDGQAFLATIYEALSQSPQWDRTLLIVTYDEHGGFYDHVPPPETTDERPEFRQLGFRIPTLIVGPRVRRGVTLSTQFDHTSFIATVTKRFGLEPLNERTEAANDVSGAMDPGLIDTAPRAAITLPSVPARTTAPAPIVRPTGQVELARYIEQLGGPRSDWRVLGESSRVALARHATRLGVLRR